MVALNLGEGLAPCAAIILTLWCMAKKPKPCGQECTLKAAHAFRAVLLKASDEPEDFETTQNVSKFVPEQVIAILDVEDGDLTVGKVSLTEASGMALAKLMAADLPVVPALAERCGRHGRGRKRKATPTATISFKHVHRRLRERSSVNVTEGQAKKVGPDQLSENTFVPGDFRRSVKGRKTMAYAVQRLVDLDRLVFSHAPLFDPRTNMCTQKGLADMSVQNLTSRAPIVFQQLFFQIRSPDAFGERVFSDIKAMFQEMRDVQPGRKKFIALLKDVKASGGCAKLHM